MRFKVSDPQPCSKLCNFQSKPSLRSSPHIYPYSIFSAASAIIISLALQQFFPSWVSTLSISQKLFQIWPLTTVSSFSVQWVNLPIRESFACFPLFDLWWPLLHAQALLLSFWFGKEGIWYQPFSPLNSIRSRQSAYTESESQNASWRLWCTSLCFLQLASIQTQP